MIPEKDEVQNYENLRDCVSELLIAKLSPTSASTNIVEKQTKRGKRTIVKGGRKNEVKPLVRTRTDVSVDSSGNDASELSETVEYLATEIFPSLPEELRTLSYSHVQNNTQLAEKYSLPLATSVYEGLLHSLPLSVQDSLTSFGLLCDPTDLPRLVEPVFSAYISNSTTAPPEFAPGESRTTAHECEICEREHLPLTYHHLIPRAVHAKVVKRGWHASWELNKVAWLCRPCHSFVHRIATNEELAKDLYSIDLLLERADVQKWAAWVSRIRWKKT